MRDGKYDGLGFALGPDGTGNAWQGIDLDDTHSRPELAALVPMLPGYVEHSPSCKGVHAIGYGPEFPTLGPNGSGIEAYSKRRYFTVTGNAIGGDIQDLGPFVTTVLEPMHGTQRALSGRVVSRPTASTEWPTYSTPIAHLTDANIEQIRAALGVLSSDDRDTWIRLGMACAAHGDSLRGLWLEWSAGSTKFDPIDAARVWDSLNPTTGIDCRAIFTSAREAALAQLRRETRYPTRADLSTEAERSAAYLAEYHPRAFKELMREWEAAR